MDITERVLNDRSVESVAVGGLESIGYTSRAVVLVQHQARGEAVNTSEGLAAGGERRCDPEKGGGDAARRGGR
jgi:hypothetical protein